MRSQPSQPWGIHWFRRDLKVSGNVGLQDAYAANDGRVVGLFTFDDAFLARPDFSHDRFHFFLDTLRSLREELRELGSDLLVLNRGPDAGFKFIFDTCDAIGLSRPELVTWNRDYEPFARERDFRIETLLNQWGIPVKTARDHLLIEPHELLNGQGEPYKVYSAFARKWFELLHTPEVQARVLNQHRSIDRLNAPAPPRKLNSVFNLTWNQLLGPSVPEDAWSQMEVKNRALTKIPTVSGGFRKGLAIAREFTSKISDYGKYRDIPSVAGTSQLSIFLKNGSLTVPQLIALFGLENCQFKADNGRTKYLQELVWREFYYYILWHSPRVEKEAFQVRFKHIKWENNTEYFQAWKDGRTGYPIVDAGMRQLLATGWMHNRVRMIVASFLTKDLLVDWRWGEKWFMERLLDGDLAPNNGGWQWAASTGCDAQPYFRIFNPTTQSERFDPGGIYIKTFVPELKDISLKLIHNPPESLRNKCGYPTPLVNHAKQRLLAL
ncbi:MAG: deoxyribodipyrimidine photo-lyase, partial [Proteobacteria bacterium]|nr:deoxyribodipyrimidine photo-lyase [Pseudomonadota bacterium]